MALTDFTTQEAIALTTEINRINEENGMLNRMLKKLYDDYRELETKAKALASQNKMSSNPDKFELSLGTSQSTEKDREREDSPTESQLPWKKRKLSSYSQQQQMDESDNENNRNVEEEQSSGTEMKREVHYKSRKVISMRAPTTTSSSSGVTSSRTSPSSSITSVMNDGCQWRKYGQKMTRNNTQPRSYYRCAMGVACPVKKQVQRCAHDASVVVTTYEGKHNHPLTPLALAIMNAASEELNTNSIVPQQIGFLNSTANVAGQQSQSISFSNYNNNNLPMFSMSSANGSSHYPTITLDLTKNTSQPYGAPMEKKSVDPEFTAAVAAAIAGSLISNMKASSSSSPPNVAASSVSAPYHSNGPSWSPSSSFLEKALSS